MIERIGDLFRNFSWTDALDIAAVFVIVLVIALFLRSVGGRRMFVILSVGTVALLAVSLFGSRLHAASKMMPYIFQFALVAFCVCFAAEIRRFAHAFVVHKHKSTASESLTDEELSRCINEIVRAVQTLSKNNTGALIVMPIGELPQHILDSGTLLGANISGYLIESIFNTKAPLHDGAIVVKGNKIVAAGCFLPLSQTLELPKDLGTRHRAALGITENSNCITIICSEETGIVSIAQNGVLTRYCDSQILTARLEEYYGLKVDDAAVRARRRRA